MPTINRSTFDWIVSAADAHTHIRAELAAYPESVNVLRDVHDDLRTSANVVDGVNDTDDARHMWLAPLMHNDVRARARAPACMCADQSNLLHLRHAYSRSTCASVELSQDSGARRSLVVGE